MGRAMKILYCSIIIRGNLLMWEKKAKVLRYGIFQRGVEGNKFSKRKSESTRGHIFPEPLKSFI